MEAIYRMKAEELNEAVLSSIRSLFKNRNIEIVVREIAEPAQKTGLHGWIGALEDSPALSGDPLDIQRRMRSE